MAKKRIPRNASFKAKIALEAIRERSTVSEIAKRHKIHPTQIHHWRRKLLDEAESIFADGRSRSDGDDSKELTKELYEQIGRLKMENEWLKKKSAELG